MAVKASRFLTHMKRLKDAALGLTRYYERVGPLGDKLAVVLWQLPPQMSKPDVGRLAAFLEAQPPSLKHAVEFRNESWYSREVLSCLDRKGAAVCEHDLLPSRPPRLTGDDGIGGGRRLLRRNGDRPPSRRRSRTAGCGPGPRTRCRTAVVKAHRSMRLSNLSFQQPDGHFLAVKCILENGSSVWRLLKPETGRQRFGCDVIFVRLDRRAQALRGFDRQLDPIRDIQVLSPTNQGLLGTRALNVELQRALNPTPVAEVARAGWLFGVGDRVMQTENDYDREVYNGDLGTVARVDPDERLLQVDFGGRTVAYGFDELDQLALAYATTVHKAQGSEYPAVVMPIMARHSRMLNRNLIYTAITCASGLVVLVGERAALEGALAVGARRRHAKLRDWLEAQPPASEAVRDAALPSSRRSG